MQSYFSLFIFRLLFYLFSHFSVYGKQACIQMTNV